MLTGEAKKAYQREYMRKRRSNQKRKTQVLDPVRPAGFVVAHACTVSGKPPSEETLRALNEYVQENYKPDVVATPIPENFQPYNTSDPWFNDYALEDKVLDADGNLIPEY